MRPLIAAQARFDSDETFKKRAKDTVVELQSGTNPKAGKQTLRPK